MTIKIRTFIIVLFSLVSSLSFGQSKKEVIEILSAKVDSLTSKIDQERNIHTQKNKELSTTITGLEDKISGLNTSLKAVNDNLTKVELQAKQLTAELNLQKNKLQKSEQLVTLKNDSLILLKKEFDDFKALDQPAAEKNYVRAKYVDFGVGDLVHDIFKDDKGNEYDFMINRSKDYELSIVSKAGDEIINPKYKGKTFDIFFKKEKYDLLGSGNVEDVDVIYKLILVN
jgi:hypothetical protein